jgi:hypothetical protein
MSSGAHAADKPANLLFKTPTIEVAQFTKTHSDNPQLFGARADCVEDFTISWSLAVLSSFQHTVSYTLGRSIAFLSKGVWRKYRNAPAIEKV